ncbi:MAG: lipoprotein-releasing ABC transporter permease subunit [Gluconacetobacter diazotrophicus]|nr:lipoprotein-releasing ABC transporter permease subunit [Gluconacetobacter diazotrophicus]
MFGAFERAVARRYLRARRGERFVSVIAIFSLVGIALGVGTLIIVMAVMNGFKADLFSRIIGLNGDLNIYGAGQTIEGYADIAARVREVPGVTGAVPMVEGQVLLNAGSYSTAGLVHGVTREDLAKLHAISDNIREGSLDQFDGDDAIAIGQALALRSNIDVGGRITLISPNGAATPFGTVPRVRAYRVVAVFDAGVNDYNAGVVFMPMKAAQTYFQVPDAATLIQVRTETPELVSRVTPEIGQALAGDRLRVVDWTKSNSALFGAVQVEQNVMFLILTLIIVVAAFNVISSMIMMVKDKARDIAVIRTLGATRGAVMRIFLMCGASVGVTGTVIGAALGIAFTLNIRRIQDVVQGITAANLFDPTVYYLTHLPEKLVWGQVAEVLAIALLLSLLATLYPSWRAARTDPVEALRHE